jgi:hypothetical protein
MDAVVEATDDDNCCPGIFKSMNSALKSTGALG